MVSEKRDHGKLSLRTDGDVDDLEEELQLRHLQGDAPLDQGICRAHNGHDNLVQELHLWNGHVDWQHHVSNVEPSIALKTKHFQQSPAKAVVD